MHNQSYRPDIGIAPLLLDVADRVAKRLDDSLKHELGIGMSQYRIMRAVAQYSRASQKTIAQLLGQTEASVSRQIALLHDQRVVGVHRDASDRRARVLILTPRGRELLERCDEYSNVFSSHLVSDTDAALLSGVLISLATHL